MTRKKSQAVGRNSVVRDFCEGLIIDLEKLTPEEIAAAEPTNALGLGIKPLGVLSDDLKALYALWMKQWRDFGEMVNQAQGTALAAMLSSDEQKANAVMNDFTTKITPAAHRADLLGAFFRALVARQIPALAQNEAQIFKHWEVIGKCDCPLCTAKAKGPKVIELSAQEGEELLRALIGPEAAANIVGGGQSPRNRPPMS